MAEIFFKDGIYLLISKSQIDVNSDNCITKGGIVNLYGNRVRLLKYDGNLRFFIDGIIIKEIDIYKDRYGEIYYSIESELSYEVVVSHLNAIEVYGLDAFIQNYKQNIVFLYGELKDINQKTESLLASEQNDSKIENLLNQLEKIRESLLLVLPILFSLQIFMISGLENAKVLSVYQSIIDSFA